MRCCANFTTVYAVTSREGSGLKTTIGLLNIGNGEESLNMGISGGFIKMALSPDGKIFTT
jgi:hypothetical protein